MSNPLDDTIESEAAKPASVSSDAGSVTRRSIDEIIKAERFLSSKRSAANGHGLFGLRVREAKHGEGG
jgi:hypothetical protein